MDKIKVLWYSDTPICETGFAQVSRNLLSQLNATGKYEFTVVGINHYDAEYDKLKFPYKIIPAISWDRKDLYGLKMLIKFIEQEQFDILFTLNDFWLINNLVPAVRSARKTKKFKWITYCPLDCSYVNQQMIDCFSEADFPVSYTNFQYDRCIKEKPALASTMRTIYHGCEKDFRILPENERRELRKQYFKIEDDCFLVINVNRNQWRKDLARTLFAFNIFNKKHKNSKLYMHSKVNDVGGSLLDQAFTIGLDVSKDVAFTPLTFNENKGYPREIVNNFYCCADAVVTTTLGEGWGLSITEAFATKTPVLAPANTSLVEILGENEERGYLAKCGTTSSEWIMSYGFSNFVRPLTNVDSFVEKLEHMYLNKQERLAKAEVAYQWAQENSWENAGKKWISVFEEAMK